MDFWIQKTTKMHEEGGWADSFLVFRLSTSVFVVSPETDTTSLPDLKFRDVVLVY
jgi:hypothetical protein